MDQISNQASGMHDIAHQSRLLRESLNSDKRKIGFMIGAGCPSGIYDSSDEKSIRLIPDVTGLTVAVSEELKEGRQKQCWDMIVMECQAGLKTPPNVEHVLTQVRTICALKGDSDVHGMTRVELRALDQRICELIAEKVGVELPTHRNSYHRFAEWVRHIDRAVPLEIFTPNYDLLVESALERLHIPYFDGFVGSREPFFDLLSLEVDVIPARWVRLWKLHGSINWIKRSDEAVFRGHATGATEQLLIYPSHLKYEQSRRMPYLGMLDRLRAFFHSTHAALIICGYSFADDHLNEVLLDGLRSNRAVHCYALMYGKMEEAKTALMHGQRHPNLTVLCSDGAVVGTKLGGYKALDGVGPKNSGYIKGADGSTLSRLGDFQHLSLFLETQFGVQHDN